MTELLADALLTLGVGLGGLDEKRISRANLFTNMNYWKSLYIPTPIICLKCFYDLQTMEINDCYSLETTDINIVEFLMAMNWLSSYISQCLSWSKVGKYWKNVSIDNEEVYLCYSGIES